MAAGAGFSLGCDQAHAAGGLPPRTAPLQMRIDAAVQLIQGDTCFQAQDTTHCSFANYELSAGTFNMSRSNGEAVLIIDDFSAFHPDLLRYRNRLLGLYDVDASGNLTSQVLFVRMPRRLGDVLTYFAGPDFVATSALTSVGQAVSTLYGKLHLSSPLHGGLVFGHLVDLVPETPLVLVQSTPLLTLPADVCGGINSQSLMAVQQHFAAVAQGLRDLIARHNVHYINVSFGDTTPVLADNWRSICGTEPPPTVQLEVLLQQYAPLYDAILNTPGVVAAHAAANLGAAVDFPFDQPGPPYANQVRVGFFSSSNSGLDEFGRGTLVATDQFPAALSDADVFITWDCDGHPPDGSFGPGTCATPHFELDTNFGLTSGTIPFMTTSFMAPLAVARLVNLRQAGHAGTAWSNDLVAQLAGELTPSLCGSGSDRCRFQDPIAHRQLEVYRLHYK